MRTVVFAVPTYGRTPCLEFQMSALGTHDLLQKHGIPSMWRYIGGDPYVAKARNRLASEFLTDYRGATDLFFIDDDVGWEPEAVVRFLEREEDVLAGVYPKKNDNLEFPVQVSECNGCVIKRDRLYRADLVPTGFLRIRRHVLERCAADSGEYEETDAEGKPVKCWDLFRTGFIPNEPDGKVGRWWGEDFFFSYMVRHYGFELWIDPDIKFSHRGSKAWTASFGDTLNAWIDGSLQGKAA